MARHSRRRSRALLPAAAVLALLIFFIYRGNTSLQVCAFDIPFSTLPEGFDGCRVAVLSDLQAEEFGADSEALLAAVASTAPDYILLAGDVADRYREMPADYLTALAEGLSAIAPTYFVTGNHDWDAKIGAEAIKDALRAGGVTVLSNEYVPLSRDGSTIYLAGVDDPNGYADQKTPEALAEELYAAENDPFWLLLAHRNDEFAGCYSLLGADLVICGHAHGGIIRLPFLREGLLGHGALFAPYSAGLYEENGTQLFVTRGLGNSGGAIRIFNRPEVAVLTLCRG